MTFGATPPAAPLPPPPPPPYPGPVGAPAQAPVMAPPPAFNAPAPVFNAPPASPAPYRPDAWAPSQPAPPAPAPGVAPAGALDGLKAKGQALLAGLAGKLFPLKKPQLAGVQATGDSKLAQVGRAAVFFALPVGGAALVACGLGWLVGPFVPFVGGHVFGAVAATLLVGHTAGTLLHGAMRLPLVTKPEEREVNSAGVTLASAGLGTLFAWGIAAAAGATITPWILLGGAALGAAPRIMEWMGGRAVQ